MPTKFYENTLTTKFIKQLVATTNVPLISTWKPGDFAIRGMFYLTKGAIWKCQHTGFPSNINDVCPENHVSHKSGAYTSEELRFFVRVSPYVFGEEYYGITGRYQSKELGYDPTTHFYLGQYLRMMRDVYDLDLMPFYNCYGGEYISDIDFNPNGEVFTSSSKNSPYKILSVPVKFGKTYMISIESDFPIECICCIYGSKGYLKELTNNLNNIENVSNPSGSNTYKKFQRTQFQNPILYKTVSWHQLYSQFWDSNLDGNDETKYIDEDYKLINDKSYDQGLGQFEKYLRLLIKVPKSNKSSVVVIEGDYPVVNTFESPNTSSVTWSNQYLHGTTINSKTVTGEWVRPEIISVKTKPIYSNIVAHIKDNNKKKEFSIPVFGEYKFENLESLKDLTLNNYVRENYGVLFDHSILENIFINLKLKYQEAPTFEISKSPLFSPLSLLQISDGNIYAFSNRLIEYLTQNAISHLDDFGKNIERVQSYSKSEMNQIKNHSRYTGALVPGVWDKDFQKYLFDLTRDSKILNSKLDLTGYVDKDTETVITRGQKV